SSHSLKGRGNLCERIAGDACAIEEDRVSFSSVRTERFGDLRTLEVGVLSNGDTKCADRADGDQSSQVKSRRPIYKLKRIRSEKG
nr:hypothetical protein [Streptomyces sp. DSM 41633]